MTNNRWPRVALAELLTERNEVPPSEQISSGEIPTISKIRFSDGQIEFRKDTETKTKMILIHPGDLVLSGINSMKGAIAIYQPIEPVCAAATIHYSAYSINLERVDTRFLWWLLRSPFFRDVLEQQVPQGIKTELKAKRLLPVVIPLPSLDEQRRIVARIRDLEQKLEQISLLQDETEQATFGILFGVYRRIAEGAPQQSMSEVAPLIRRTVQIKPDEEYPELGLRSWGKGTFHKPAINGIELNGKRIYKIEAGDLLFSNVFSWEGAVAVAKTEDDGRYGSHRYISRVVKPGMASAHFLYFHFMTEEGLQQLRNASPGSAGRNRTLGLNALDTIKVPVPEYKLQCWFDEIFTRVEAIRQEQVEIQLEANALLSAVLEQTFRGEL